MPDPKKTDETIGEQEELKFELFDEEENPVPEGEESEVESEEESTSSSEENEEESPETQSDEASDGDEEDEESEELDPQSKIARLEALVEQLLADKNKTPEEVAASEDKQESEVKPRDYITEEEHDELVGSSEGYNKVMTKIEEGIVQRAIQTAVVEAQKRTSFLIQWNDMTKSFYDNNEDLKNHTKLVQYTATQLQSKHPDWDFPTFFQNLAKETRKQLGISAPKGSKPGVRNVPVRQGGKQRGTSNTPKKPRSSDPLLDLLNDADFDD